MLTWNHERLDPGERAALARLVASPRYELVPTSSARDASEKVPEGMTVTITASPKRGIEATADLAIELAARGRRVVPHIAARLIEDRPHLFSLVQRLLDSGVDELFVIGGDGKPRGEFRDSLGVLAALEAEGITGLTVGIAGYPEGHPLITDATLVEVLLAKQRFASYVTTQMCFDPAAISRWIEEVRDLGVTLPVHIGITGVVAVSRLLSLGSRIGVGASLRFLTRHRGLWRRLSSRRYSPEELLWPLAPTVAAEGSGIIGLHVYTFNQVDATERWREEFLQELLR